MKANKRAAVKIPKASKAAPSSPPASPEQLSNALGYYGAMAPHGKG